MKLDYLPGIKLAAANPAATIFRAMLSACPLWPVRLPSSGIFFQPGSDSKAAKASQPISAPRSEYFGRSPPFSAASGWSWPLLSRISSLAALTAALLTPVYVYMIGEPWLAALLGAMSALLIAKHHANIKRLLAGEEPRIGAKK